MALCCPEVMYPLNGAFDDCHMIPRRSVRRRQTNILRSALLSSHQIAVQAREAVLRTCSPPREAARPWRWRHFVPSPLAMARLSLCRIANAAKAFHHCRFARARTAAAFTPIWSACFSRLSTRSACHRATSRWRIPFRRITPCRHSRKHTFQEPVKLLKLGNDRIVRWPSLFKCSLSSAV